MPILPNNTLSSIVNIINRANSDPVVQPPLSNAAFTLDSSGVAGFFGGESAVRAMGTAYLIPKRRWLGWYNAPGAYEVAKQYSGLAKSHLFNALFPGSDSDPAKILMVDGQLGPEYTPLYSLTGRAPSSIGHLGSLIARKVSQMPVTETLELGTKRTTNTRVTFVNLRRIVPGEFSKLKLFPSSSIIFTVFTILISVGGCIACALVADWFCFASIALGIIANGVACSVIGSGELYLKNNPPPQAGSPGDILLKGDTNIIILIGDEGMVRPFTHGRFVLLFGEVPSFGLEKVRSSSPTAEKTGDHKGGDTRKPNPPTSTVSWSQRIVQKWLTVDISVILLLFQFLAQLLLIPQGTLFGQLMFIGTLVPSWMYHSYLSTLGLDLQTQALFQTLSIQESYDIFQYQLNTWTQAAVFSCLVFMSIHPPLWVLNTTEGDAVIQEDADVVKQAKEDAAAKKKATFEHAKMAADNVKTVKVAAGVVATSKAKKAEEAKKVAADASREAEKAKWEAKVAEAEAEAEAEAGEKVAKAAKAASKMLEATKKEAQAAVQENAAKMAVAVAAKAAEEVESLSNEEKEAEKAQEKAENEMESAQYLNKIKKEEETKRKEQYENRTTQQKEKAEKALRVLLDTLLPGQTDVWRAFKESLVRKLSVVNNSGWAYMESKGTFEFNDSEQSKSISVQGGVRMLQSREDLTQLQGYQDDADSALTAWREGKILEIAQQFQ